MILGLLTLALYAAWWVIYLSYVGRVGLFLWPHSRWYALFSRVFFETRWLWPWACVWCHFFTFALTGRPMEWGHYFSLAIDALMWWGFRREKDDDDRWKRRMKSARETVQAAGHRLVVVPT